MAIYRWRKNESERGKAKGGGLGERGREVAMTVSRKLLCPTPRRNRAEIETDCDDGFKSSDVA